ncbi:MAG: HAD-IA family hydrolase [Bacteroidales bacterium]|nr:HAD-IA family hydrolase [Bacteroidales bacterium]MDD3523057.1 HAD-IA family hydrolase [Bacteroidales bacterium]MDD4030223.1 HAD-IA family hydrolase [Bacteroidales bacterium]MDD4435139.1 HAD-IA family hydrolase [Bacteroidales bacterium]
MKTIQYILFDFDGTLADTFDLVFTLYNSIAGEYGCKPLKPEDRQIIAAGKPQDLLRQYNMSAHKLGLITIRIRKEILSHVPQMKPFEGMKEVLTTLRDKGYRLGIITSNARPNVVLFLENNGMNSLFDFVYSGKSLFGKDKVFKRMLAKKKIHPASAIYVGDETRDIEACRKVGIPIVSVTWGMNNREILSTLNPDQMAHTPQEIIRCIAALS